MRTDPAQLRRRADGSIDTALYMRRAARLRRLAIHLRLRALWRALTRTGRLLGRDIDPGQSRAGGKA